MADVAIVWPPKLYIGSTSGSRARCSEISLDRQQDVFFARRDPDRILAFGASPTTTSRSSPLRRGLSAHHRERRHRDPEDKMRDQ
jgi:hypothetical protein